MRCRCRIESNIVEMDLRIFRLGLALSRFFFCLQSHFLFVFDLFLFDLLVEVAPVAARDDELVGLELRVNALCPVKRSEEHTSELQSQFHLVCRLLLEKKKKKYQ